MSDEDEDLHSEMGPSTAHRWRKCPPSVALSRGIPNTAGMAAAEGTVFHEIAATCLEFFLDPQGFVGFSMEVKPHGRIVFDQKMADHMLFGLDLLWSLTEIPDAKMIVEKRVSLENWVGKGEFGTTDCAIIDIRNKRIYVFDWKYGAGVPVSPEDNDQAILYFLGVWDEFAYSMFHQYYVESADEWNETFDENMPWEDDIEVVIMIEQPRAPGGGGTWTTTVGALLAEGEKIRRDAEIAKSGKGAFNPGPKQCQFCPAARTNICEARARHVLDLVGADFDALQDDFAVNADMELPKAFTPEQRSQILLNRSLIDKLLEQLHEEAYGDARMGRPTPGLKLVDGRNPPRKWRNEVHAAILAERALGKKAYTTKLLSPTQLEEAVGKRDYKLRFERMVNTGESKAVLVPETDKRKALPDITSDFDLAYGDDDGVI